jgi:hypothetical protein
MPSAMLALPFPLSFHLSVMSFCQSLLVCSQTRVVARPLFRRKPRVDCLLSLNLVYLSHIRSSLKPEKKCTLLLFVIYFRTWLRIAIRVQLNSNIFLHFFWLSLCCAWPSDLVIMAPTFSDHLCCASPLIVSSWLQQSGSNQKSLLSSSLTGAAAIVSSLETLL